jgi:hypothetical protein
MQSLKKYFYLSPNSNVHAVGRTAHVCRSGRTGHVGRTSKAAARTGRFVRTKQAT